MEYILFIHKNTDTPTTPEAWDSFFTAAAESGLFMGGSEIANRIQFGKKAVPDITEHLGGFMRFNADSLSAVSKLLEQHPVLTCGGTLELCEMPKS